MIKLVVYLYRGIFNFVQGWIGIDALLNEGWGILNMRLYLVGGYIRQAVGGLKAKYIVWSAKVSSSVLLVMSYQRYDIAMCYRYCVWNALLEKSSFTLVGGRICIFMMHKEWSILNMIL